MAEFPGPASSESAPRSAPLRHGAREILKRCLPVLRVILAGAILTGLIRWIGPEQVLTRLAACPLPAALAGFAIAFLALWVGSVRLWLLARSRAFPLSNAQALAVNLTAVMYGLILPGGSATGWLVRLLRLSSGLSRLQSAVWILSSDRIFATGVGAAIGLLAGIFVVSPVKPAVSLLLFAIVLGMSAAMAILFASSMEFARMWAERIPVLRRFTPFLVRSEVFEGRPGMRTACLATLLSVLVHVGGIASWLILASAFDLDVGAWDIAWVRSAALVAALLPATAGGLGLREGAVVFLMATLGVDRTDALSLALLVFSVTILPIGVLGAILELGRLLMDRRSPAQTG